MVVAIDRFVQRSPARLLGRGDAGGGRRRRKRERKEDDNDMRETVTIKSEAPR